MALELRISVITVKKAWELLEGQGLIVTRVGRGTVVSSLSDEERHTAKADLMQKNLAQNLQYYQELGFSREEILESIRKHLSGDDERNR